MTGNTKNSFNSRGGRGAWVNLCGVNNDHCARCVPDAIAKRSRAYKSMDWLTDCLVYFVCHSVPARWPIYWFRPNGAYFRAFTSFIISHQIRIITSFGIRDSGISERTNAPDPNEQRTKNIFPNEIPNRNFRGRSGFSGFSEPENFRISSAINEYRSTFFQTMHNNE